MADHAEYAHTAIQVLTLRDAIQRRPRMYFGDHPTPDWPLVIAAWTAVNLLEYAAIDAQQVDLTLHRTGALAAVVRKACVTTFAASRLSAQELVRRKMWWADLARDVSVKVRGAAQPRLADEALVWEDVDIEVTFEPDPEMIGVAPGTWWHDGPARLRQIFTAPHHAELTPGQKVIIADEATGNVIVIKGLTVP